MHDPQIKLTEHAMIRLFERAIGVDMSAYIQRARVAIMEAKPEVTFCKRETEYLVRISDPDIYAVFVKKPHGIVVKTFLTPEQVKTMRESRTKRKRDRKEYVRDTNEDRLERDIDGAAYGTTSARPSVTSFAATPRAGPLVGVSKPIDHAALSFSCESNICE